MSSTYYPATQCLGIYPRNVKTNVHKTTCTGMFIAVSSQQEQPKCPSIGERLQNKLWYSNGREDNTAVERNELLTHATVWTNLAHLMPSERS